MRIKSNWRLVRLGEQKVEYDLNDGETKIGRSVKSQIRTQSEICSRVHCAIQIDANGEITIEDKSRNGIFVNSVRCKATKLKDGDIFGLACDQSIFDFDIPNKGDFFVFKLQKISSSPNVNDRINDSHNIPVKTNSTQRAYSLDESPASPDTFQNIETDDQDFSIQLSYDDNECNVNKLAVGMAKQSLSTTESHSATKRPISTHIEGTPIADKKYRTPVDRSYSHGGNASHFNVDAKIYEANRAPPPSLNVPLNTSMNTSVNASFDMGATNYYQKGSAAVNDAMNKLITEIIEWKTEWLTSNELEPPIVADKRSLLPLQSGYSTYNTYESVLVPLLKYELWANVLLDHHKIARDSFGATKKSMSTRESSKRVVIQAQVNIEVDSTKRGDLLLVEAKNCPKFFAYVSWDKFDDATNTIQFAMEASSKVMEKLGETLRILNVKPIANILTGLKLFNALFLLKYSPFLSIVLNPRSHIPNENQIKDVQYVGQFLLDNNQMEIMKTLLGRCLNKAPSLSVIEGHAGSGKTHLIAALIVQMMLSKEIDRTYNILVLSSTNAGISAITESMVYIRQKLSTRKGGNNDLNFIRFPTQDLQSFDKATVVCSTLIDSINIRRSFDFCILDEAAQCTESWTFVPLLYKFRSLILAGDLKQMPPFVASSICREKDLAKSFFERFMQDYSRKVVHRKRNIFTLQIQYRMHPDIFDFPNKEFYQGHGINGYEPQDDRFEVNAYNVFDLNYKQSKTYPSEQYNSDEAEFVVDVLKEVVKLANPNKYTYGIITPNVDVRDKIRDSISKAPIISNHTFDVNTIDSFQGKHKDIVLISTAKEGNVFSGNLLNLALTRAKKCLIICGNFESLLKVDVWKNLYVNARQRCNYHKFSVDYSFDMISSRLRSHHAA